MKTTVVQYLLAQIKKLGIKEVFGVPGDYAFPIDDAITADPDLKWIGNCNELNAAYAADGYARLKGFAAVTTTYGVGELCALGALGGAFAERSPVIHIVGMPTTKVMKEARIVHHTLGNGDYEAYFRMVEPVVAASAILTPQNAVTEVNRVISQCVQQRKPVYFGISFDLAPLPIEEQVVDVDFALHSNPQILAHAVEALYSRLKSAKKPVVLGGMGIQRLGLGEKLMQFVQKAQIPYASTCIEKTCLDETLPEHIGLYCGDHSKEDVKLYVETSDCILNFGILMSNVNTWFWSFHWDPQAVITIDWHETVLGTSKFESVEMADVLDALLAFDVSQIPHLKPNPEMPHAQPLEKVEAAPGDKITTDYLYPRLQQWLKPNDIVVVDTGSVSKGMLTVLFPKGSMFVAQQLWMAIGWATPAAFGAAMAAPDRRVVLMTGEGAFQMTAQEITQFARYGLKPVIIVVNNEGYLIERVLSDFPGSAYNDLAQWRYSALPHALGMDSFTSVRVEKCGELDDVLNKAQLAQNGFFIEVMADKNDFPRSSGM